MEGLTPLNDLVQLELRKGTAVQELIVTLEEFNKLFRKIEDVLNGAAICSGDVGPDPT